MTSVHQKLGGFTLTELMVTVSVMGILMALGLPAMAEWMANSRIRSASESVLTGLQLARSEAIRRNANIRFLLVGTDGGWQIISEAVDAANQPQRCTFNAGTLLQQSATTTANRAISVGAFSNAAATDVSASQEFIFGPNGWRSCPNIPVFLALSIDSSAISASQSRNLRIVVQPGGSSRMCDPNVAAPDTRACPA